MEKLILDYSTWSCGGDKPGPNKLGIGATALLNNKGYMCCLGQFSLQMGATTNDIFHKIDPQSLEIHIPLLNLDPLRGDYKNKLFLNTLFSATAININDDQDTAPEEKIKLLSKLLKKEGYQLEVINKPE